jgi:hypothetical protein
MSQPFFLYDKNGKLVKLSAPIWAAKQVEAGVYFTEKPKRKYTKRKVTKK